jgi:hypothetical protein
MSQQIGERFAGALARKDATELKALLRPDVDFRAMTPGKFWEASNPDAVVDDIVFGAWFEPDDRITGIIDLDNGTIGPRHRTGYRFAVSCPDGDYVVEQQAYFETDGRQISWLRVMCSGYHPVVPT